MGRLMPRQFSSKRWLISLNPLLSHLFLNKTGGMWYGISLWLVWVIHLLMSPHKPLCNIIVFTGGAEWETEEVLMLCRPCSAVAKILVCYQYCFVISTALVTNVKHRTTAAAGKIINFILTRPSPSSHRRLNTNSIYLEKEGSLKKRIVTTQLSFHSQKNTENKLWDCRRIQKINPTSMDL